MSAYLDFSKVSFGPGFLDGIIFENPSLEISRDFFFNMRVEVGPFEWMGETIKTLVQLDLIEIELNKSWREIENRAYEFPINPVDGYIDGSILLDDMHCPADVTKIEFGKIEESKIRALFDVILDFEFEGPASLGRQEVKWDMELIISQPELDEVFSQR